MALKLAAVLLIVVVVLGTLTVRVESRTLPESRNCTIPGQPDVGVCRPVAECVAFQKIANESESNLVAERDFVEALWCGERDEGEICCPRDGADYQAMEEPEDEECGVQGLQYRIRGGAIAQIDEFPWTAMLLKENGKTKHLEYHCGGALISRTFVLSAAHCVTFNAGGTNIKDPIKFVRLREYNFFTDPDCEVEGNMLDCAEQKVDREPRRIVVHPGFMAGTAPTYNHDLALIQIDPVPPYTDFLRPICLPERGMRPRRFLTVAGWGKTDFFKDSFGTINFSPIKMKVVLPHVDWKLCQQVYKLLHIRVNESHVCAGGKIAQDSCAGDSGSPLMQYDPRSGTWFLMGVASFGVQNCGREGIPGVYTNLGTYLDWIRENIQQS
ncbi:hypothetical protein pipiens_013922 [Culex pipiens pipiens]|uniref:CLIP domain-containing serine protease n=1 Tax=Culex pipiens pipiens TaxID=38569 RepID=A0ABD1CWQ5_CULPP